MRILFTALTAVAVGLGGIAATATGAQTTTRTVTVENNQRHYEGPRRHHTRRVCDTVWRHHHKVKRCRTVRR